LRFSDWAAGQFETWQDRVKGANAAAEIILPIAAAAVGMTAFAIVFHYGRAARFDLRRSNWMPPAPASM
jgi:hypothetical protein